VAVAGARVRLDDGAETRSDESGRFALAPVQCAGEWSATAEREGFGVLPPQRGVFASPSQVVTGIELHLPPADNALAAADWGFESGSFASAWTTGGVPAPQVVGGFGHSGDYAAYVGTPMTTTAPGGESFVAITVTVPLTAYQPVLSFFYRIVTMDNSQHDVFEARLNGQLVLSDGYSGSDFGTVRDLGWKHAWFSLSAYVGQRVALRLAVVQGQAYASYPTGAYIDEVSIGSASGGAFASRLPVIISER
jgi:hypothetical protein